MKYNNIMHCMHMLTHLITVCLYANPCSYVYHLYNISI